MSPFTTCANGHPTTKPEHYIYRSGGTRECRQCAYEKDPRRKRRSKGDFNSGNRMGL